ncbi:MAG: glycoside hydrolase family 16 protein [Ferruginibacter sp.]
MNKIIYFLFFLSQASLPAALNSCAGNSNDNIKSEKPGSQIASKSGNGLNIPIPSEYSFAWGDEFDSNNLDSKKWFLRREGNASFGPPNTRSNIKVANGYLTLLSKSPPAGALSSAEVSTEGLFNFRYGYFEIRAQLSSGVGGECAFWMTTPKTSVVSNPFDPVISGAEIDIFENGIGHGINKLYYSLHWNGYEPAHAKVLTQVDSIPGIYEGFHTFALEWTPRKYSIYVDGKVRITTDTIVSHVPEFILLGIGPGGFGGSAALFPNPSSFLVDYIRVYNRRAEVTLFGDTNYRGWVSNGLLPGSYTNAQLVSNGCVNNMLSSVEIPSGWTVTLYDGDNFSGKSKLLNSGDIQNLGAWNGITSSLKITTP